VAHGIAARGVDVVPALVEEATRRGGEFTVASYDDIAQGRLEWKADTLPYQEGWREGSWDGFSRRFVNAAPWCFRTLESWRALFAHCGLRLVSEHWPVHPGTGRPASVVFCAVADSVSECA